MARQRGLEVNYEENPTELYKAICSGDWENAESIAKSDPKQVKTWVVRYDNENKNNILWRFLPLHTACARQPPDTIIETLLSSYPLAACITDDQGFLPLHYACGNRASEGIVSLLLIAFSEGASMRQNSGKFPLHYLCQWGASSIGAIMLLITAYPQALKEKDENGCTPLELSKISNYPGRESIVKILERNVNTPIQVNHSNITRIETRKELDDISAQEEKIEKLKRENLRLREDSAKARKIIHTEDAKISLELNSKQKLKDDLSQKLDVAQDELEKMEDMKAQSSQQHRKNLETIKYKQEEIISLRKNQAIILKESKILEEKLKIKYKMNNDTIAELEQQAQAKQQEVEDCRVKVEELVIEEKKLRDNLDLMHDSNMELSSTVDYLKDCQHTCSKVDTLSKSLSDMLESQENFNNRIKQYEKDFVACVAERERRILELARVEEKLRESSETQYLEMVKDMEAHNLNLQILLRTVNG